MDTTPTHEATGRPEPDVLRAIVGYCRSAEGLAQESTTPEAVGLARAYKDVADRLDGRLAETRVPAGVGARGLVCRRCSEPPRGHMVSLQAGGWMHRSPCWEAALEEAFAADVAGDAR